MDKEPEAPSPVPLRQSIAGLVMALVLLFAGVWILREFLVALAWAGVFAIALWPLYQRLLLVTPAGIAGELAPALLVAAVGLVFILPLVLLGVAVARELHVVIEFIAQARRAGIAPPDWLAELPRIGPSLAAWWRANLGDPAVVHDWFGRFDTRTLAESARYYGREVVHRVILFGFMLLTLFFLFRDGTALAGQLRGLGDRMLGPRGERIALQMIAAVHGTVTGLVLVGLAEGVILGIVYFAAGVPYPASIGAVTGVAAVIPFAAPVVFGVTALYMAAQGHMVAAIVVVGAGAVVVFIADHVVRPVLIGGAARLPFLWVLLGILGGVETLGFLGLFLGPAIMAALVALWREWTEGLPASLDTARPAPARRRVNGRRAGGRES